MRLRDKHERALRAAALILADDDHPDLETAVAIVCDAFGCASQGVAACRPREGQLCQGCHDRLLAQPARGIR